MYSDLMIDIECLATGSNAVVTQIGAVAFNITTGECDDHGMCINLNIQEQLDHGRVISGRTLNWWINELLEQKVCTWNTGPNFVVHSIQELQKYVAKFCHKGFNQWSHTFDQQILNHLAYMFNHKLPWSYKQQRDIRTLTCLAGMTKRPSDMKLKKTHNGLEDAEYQVEYCCEAWRKIHD